MDFNNLRKDNSKADVSKSAKSKKAKPTPKKGNGRQQAIENCEICNGNPTEVTDFKIVNFCGKKCETCYIVISYEKDNSAGSISL